MKRVMKDKENSKPISVENGVVTYTSTKSGLSKEIIFNINEIKHIDIDDDETEFLITLADSSITFYADYFDSKAEYEEFQKLLSAVKIKN